MKELPELPTRQHHFPKLICGGYTYVDKTHHSLVF